MFCPLLNRQISTAGEQGTDGVVSVNQGRKGVRDEEGLEGRNLAESRDKTVIKLLVNS